MTINSIEVFIYTAYFLLPGYIISEIINCIVPSKKVSDAEKTIRCIGYSFLDLAIWFWLIRIVNKKVSDNWYWFVLMLIVLISSVITGLTIGIIKKKIQ